MVFLILETDCCEEEEEIGTGDIYIRLRPCTQHLQGEEGLYTELQMSMLVISFITLFHPPPELNTTPTVIEQTTQ
jgi:hypothetical protein